MSAWDYIMPHRLLINKSLRKASQELRDKIELYQIEFNRRLEECNADLQHAEEEKNKELDEFRTDILQKLSDDYHAFEEVQDNIVQYMNCYFERTYLFHLSKINKKKDDIFHEEYVFLSRESKAIDNEITLLRERQNELTAFTKVDDIIQLATLTGYDLDFQSTDDAKQLLGKISDALRNYNGEDKVEKYALLRLKTIIQERSDYLPTINYISWVIQIKIRLKKQLSIKRSDVEREQNSLREKQSSIKKEIQTLTNRLNLLAEKIRYYWAKPITYLNAEICYAYKELKEEKERQRNDGPALRDTLKEFKDKKKDAISEIQDKKRKRRDLGSELRDMRDSHSSDQWRWDSLKSDCSSLSSDIDSLSSDIDGYSREIELLQSELASLKEEIEANEQEISARKEERKEWAEKRTYIVNFIKQYDKRFPSNRTIAEGDEINIIETRLKEIQLIREAGVDEAEKWYQLERKKIIREHEKKSIELNARKQVLETEYQNADEECSKCAQRVLSAEKEFETRKMEDDRSIILKWFSESTAVITAEEELKKRHLALTQANETKERIASLINELENEIKAENNDFNRMLVKCKPRNLRPSTTERHEEKILQLRREEINQQHKESDHES